MSKRAIVNRGTRKMYGGDMTLFSPPSVITMDSRVSGSPNTDPNYIEDGFIQVTASGGINVVRGVYTALSNITGLSGRESTIVTYAKRKAIDEMRKKLKEGQKICDLSIQIEVNAGISGVVFAHANGTIFRRK